MVVPSVVATVMEVSCGSGCNIYSCGSAIRPAVVLTW